LKSISLTNQQTLPGDITNNTILQTPSFEKECNIVVPEYSEVTSDMELIEDNNDLIVELQPPSTPKINNTLPQMLRKNV